MHDQAAGDVRPHFMERVFERRRDAEIAAAAANRPEQIRVFIGARPHHTTIGHHQLGRTKVIERQSVLGHQPAETAAKRQPRNTGDPDNAAGCGQAMELGFAIEFLPQHTALRADGLAVTST